MGEYSVPRERPSTEVEQEDWDLLAEIRLELEDPSFLEDSAVLGDTPAPGQRRNQDHNLEDKSEKESWLESSSEDQWMVERLEQSLQLVGIVPVEIKRDSTDQEWEDFTMEDQDIVLRLEQSLQEIGTVPAIIGVKEDDMKLGKEDDWTKTCGVKDDTRTMTDPVLGRMTYVGHEGHPKSGHPEPSPKIQEQVRNSPDRDIASTSPIVGTGLTDLVEKPTTHSVGEYKPCLVVGSIAFGGLVEDDDVLESVAGGMTKGSPGRLATVPGRPSHWKVPTYQMGTPQPTSTPDPSGGRRRKLETDKLSPILKLNHSSLDTNLEPGVMLRDQGTPIPTGGPPCEMPDAMDPPGLRVEEDITPPPTPGSRAERPL